MTRQMIEPIRMNALRFLLLLLILFGVGTGALFVCKWLIALTGVGLFDALFLVVAALLLYAVIQLTTLRFAYVVDGDQVKILKAYGEKISTLIELRASQILGVAKYEAGVKYKEKYRSVTWMAQKKRVSAVLMYRQDGAVHALLFAPNEEILSALRAQKEAAAAQNAEDIA